MDRIGIFVVTRITMRKRLAAKLKGVKEELRKRMHESTVKQGKWLASVVRGYFQYHAIPGNIDQLRLFKARLNRMWRNVLVRRSQRAQIRWERLTPVFSRWIPEPRNLHPYPDARFNATNPR